MHKSNSPPPTEGEQIGFWEQVKKVWKAIKFYVYWTYRDWRNRRNYINVLNARHASLRQRIQVVINTRRMQGDPASLTIAQDLDNILKSKF